MLLKKQEKRKCKKCGVDFLTQNVTRLCLKCRSYGKSTKKANVPARTISKKKRRKEKSLLELLRDKLWELCKQIVRKRDGNRCIICGKTNLVGSNWHTGHFIPSSICGGYLRYDLRNLHSSCYNCNINLGGNGALYYVALVQNYTQEFVDRIIKDKNTTIKLDKKFYEEKIKEYEKVLQMSPDRIFIYTQK